MLSSTLIVSFFLSNVLALPQKRASDLSGITSLFQEKQLVPDVFPSFKPSALLDVVYTDPSTKNPINVTAGGTLSVQQTANVPQFFLRGAENIPYVIAMIDPDAPTPQNTSLAQVRHILGGNFQLSENGELKNTTAALSDYLAPMPPPGSDPHRYTVVVYKQPSPDFDCIAGDFVNGSTPIIGFNLTGFAEKVGLGEPIAGMFWFTGPNGTSSEASNTSGAGSLGVHATKVVTGVIILIAMLL
ncbi:hypothetical protein VNI00_012261 [Paramarasmius palmivorus]|uniref:PEBP-like protein n=1 Tax=Paramarasmius palmivorus TaxID=297713 RepID=A0AAW0C654_9AGAR